MTEQGGFQADETAPIAASNPSASSPVEFGTPPTSSAAQLAPAFPTPTVVPAVPPAAPIVSVPAGWYPINGEQRYWDGLTWTEHRAPAAVPAYQPAFPTPVVMTDARTNGVEVAIAWIVAVLSVGYMLPWAIAATRGKSNSWAVGLVNFLLGWTLIGWIAALVMACTAHQVAFVGHRI